MNKNIRWKVITILAVLVIFAAVGVYPIIASQYGITSPSWRMASSVWTRSTRCTPPFRSRPSLSALSISQDGEVMP